MKDIPIRLLVKLLTLVLLVSATVALGPIESKTQACWKCVTLDPGSAINQGCMEVTQGDLGCTPVNGDYCIMSGTWCKKRLETVNNE
jgi:hypothetical protein